MGERKASLLCKDLSPVPCWISFEFHNGGVFLQTSLQLPSPLLSSPTVLPKQKKEDSDSPAPWFCARQTLQRGCVGGNPQMPTHHRELETQRANAALVLKARRLEILSAKQVVPPITAVVFSDSVRKWLSYCFWTVDFQRPIACEGDSYFLECAFCNVYFGRTVISPSTKFLNWFFLEKSVY